ncbi:type II toxin-antitoxin system VapC family toxin [Methanoregula sp.]|uniref:type II toxin-antitoxin system VapC family toxin n=1 Tax=Methanoregula sp. TaxID=2052170 RepID=UPI0035695267
MSDARVYFDTSIWYSYMVKDKHTEKAKKLFAYAEENKIKIAVSHLVLLELFDIIRKRTIENSEYNGLSDDRKKQLIQNYEDTRQEIAEKISKLWKAEKIEIKDPDNKIVDHYKNIYKYLVQSFGDIGQKDWCFDCKCKMPQIKYKYQGTGHLDIQHALIARDFQIKQFVTFDKGFSEIIKNKEFESLKIEIY